MGKWLYRYVIGLALLVLALRGLDWVARRGAALPALPAPNGYEELLAIAEKIKPLPAELEELRNAQIREIAGENRAALEKIHQALEADSAVPLKADRDWKDKHEQDVKRLKRLAVALAIQSRADPAEGRTNDAVRCHLDVMLLGQAIARGGLLLDGIHGLTVETLGAGLLMGDLATMDAIACRASARALEKAEGRREPLERMLETEKRWSTARFGLIGRVGGLLLREAQAKRRAEFETRSHKVIRRTRRLTLLLAGRAFELETGKRASQVADLVPGFLAAVPIDPVTGVAFSEIPKVGGED